MFGFGCDCACFRKNVVVVFSSTHYRLQLYTLHTTSYNNIIVEAAYTVYTVASDRSGQEEEWNLSTHYTHAQIFFLGEQQHHPMPAILFDIIFRASLDSASTTDLMFHIFLMERIVEF
jgi:hypothetical protein